MSGYFESLRNSHPLTVGDYIDGKRITNTSFAYAGERNELIPVYRLEGDTLEFRPWSGGLVVEKVPDWDKVAWRLLEKGERVETGDWEDTATDGWRDDPRWEPATRSVGKLAPDPRFPAHRRFRRIIRINHNS